MNQMMNYKIPFTVLECQNNLCFSPFTYLNLAILTKQVQAIAFQNKPLKVIFCSQTH